MIVKIYSIYDSKGKLFHPPMTFRNSGDATRWFTDMSNDKQHPYGRYSEDYTLFETGEFNDESGTIEQYEAKKSLGLASQFKELAPSNVTQLTN